MRSIERYLLAWILGALALGAVLIALVAYLVMLDDMNEVFDANLRNVAHTFAIARGSALLPGAPEMAAQSTGSDVPDAAQIVICAWTGDGHLVFTSDANAQLPFIAHGGLSSRTVANEEWIIYTEVQPRVVVQAAQRAAGRRETAGESASKIFPPLLGLMVAIGALAAFALRRGLLPLDDAAHDVASRSARSLAPIPAVDVPREIAPLVLAINGLMSRLSAALTMQRDFLADAAHELRTPVTALRLQLQLLERSGDDVSRQDALAELKAGIDRSQHLVEQLLQVARSEPDGEVMGSGAVDLSALARSAVAASSAKAEQRGLDLGACGGNDIMVRGDAHQLQVLLNNLIENALRYTPAGGVVDVEATRIDGRPALRVIDDGPGIAPEERERVFERFRRGQDAQMLARDTGGSGLGLAIVRSIAERHAAAVSLHTAESGRGLEVRVLFATHPA